MSIVELLLVIIIAGVVLWALTQFPAIDPTLKRVAQVVIIAAVVIWIAVSLLGGDTDVLNKDISID
jgi:cytochrome b subunit of formate dehydrogenase